MRYWKVCTTALFPLCVPPHLGENHSPVQTISRPKETRRLLPDSASSVYAPPRPGTSAGHIILSRDGSLVAQPVDDGTLRPSGEMIPIAEKANTLPGTFSVSTTGTLLYQNAESIPTRLTYMDRSGKELMAVGEPAGISDFALSPDEKRIVIVRANVT